MTSFYASGQTQVIRVTGEKRHDFLNRMTTSDLRNPAPSSVIPTLLTTEKGRVLDLVWHLERGEESWLVPSPGRSETIFRRLDQLLFPMDKAALQLDARPSRLILAMDQQPSADALRWKAIPGGISWPVSDWFSGGEFMLLQDTEFAGRELQKHQFLSETDFQQKRLQQGVPLWGSELTGEYHVQELGLLWAVDFSKGCYPGQEVVARIYNYEKNQRQPALVSWSAKVVPALPAKLVSQDERAGIITSYAQAERGFCGFGLLRGSLVAEARDLFLDAGDGLVPVSYEAFPQRNPKGLKGRTVL